MIRTCGATSSILYQAQTIRAATIGTNGAAVARKVTRLDVLLAATFPSQLRQSVRGHETQRYQKFGDEGTMRCQSQKS